MATVFMAIKCVVCLMVRSMQGGDANLTNVVSTVSRLLPFKMFNCKHVSPSRCRLKLQPIDIVSVSISTVSLFTVPLGWQVTPFTVTCHWYFVALRIRDTPSKPGTNLYGLMTEAVTDKHLRREAPRQNSELRSQLPFYLLIHQLHEEATIYGTSSGCPVVRKQTLSVPTQDLCHVAEPLVCSMERVRCASAHHFIAAASVWKDRR
jgi:hypothetical protein